MLIAIRIPLVVTGRRRIFVHGENFYRRRAIKPALPSNDIGRRTESIDRWLREIKIVARTGRTHSARARELVCGGCRATPDDADDDDDDDDGFLHLSPDPGPAQALDR